jgi:hypothetical protein
MNYLLHIANGLFLVSYTVKDILWLRVLAVVANGVLLIYFIQPAEPMWESIAWATVFTLINLYQIAMLLLERRPVRLSEDELRLYRMTFRTVTPREFVRLLEICRWRDADAGAKIVEVGVDPADVMVIYSGAASVRVDERPVAQLRPGQLVGEMSFLTGQAPNADVVTNEPTRYVCWPKRELRAFLDTNRELRSAFQLVIGTDLVGKLRVEPSAAA